MSRFARVSWIVLLAGLSACGGAGDMLHGRIRTHSNDLKLAQGAGVTSVERSGMLRWLYDDLGGLVLEAGHGNAIPWKVMAAGLVRDRTARLGTPTNMTQVSAAFAEFGFFDPDSLLNAIGPQPARRRDHPIGIVTGVADSKLPSARLEIANISCASCHVGVTYDATGNPTRNAWVGLPNSSVDVSAFGLSVYHGLKSALGNRDALLATIDTLFPNIDAKERKTIQKRVLPLVDKRIGEMAAGPDSPIPFRSGGPGLSNSIASMKLQLGILPTDHMSTSAGYASVPDLAYRQMRSSLLYDGGYAIPGQEREAVLEPAAGTDQHMNELARIASVFSVAVMGVRISEAPHNIGSMTEMMRFVRVYRPPPFPGPIDMGLAAEGASVYAGTCARCHGDVAEQGNRLELQRLPNRHLAVGLIGTDGTRAAAADSAIAQALRAGYAKLATIDSTGKYVALPLAGIWATAPYLHNGSVPTLWHMLHPEARPERFYVGGHRLDFARVGIAGDVGTDGTMRYPEGYKPWATPRLYDTRDPGRGNRGHEGQFSALSEAQKRALLEYLKRL